MSQTFARGTAVKWKWGSGWGHGNVDQVFTKKVTRTIKGSKITRNAAPDDPAYLIVQEDKDRVLKLHSEVQAR